MLTNKQAAVKEVRTIANQLIEQNERIAKGYDKGNHRDDEMQPTPWNAIKYRTRENVRYAFALSKAFANT